MIGLESGCMREWVKSIGLKVGVVCYLGQTKLKAQGRHLGLFPSLDLTQVASIY